MCVGEKSSSQTLLMGLGTDLDSEIHFFFIFFIVLSITNSS